MNDQEEYDRAYAQYVDRELARGELAGAPETMPCYDCTRAAGRDPFEDDQLIEKKVVAHGPTVEAHRDPTATYKLECGHFGF